MGEKRQYLYVVGKTKERVNALLDSGANTSYIDVKLANKLKIPLYRQEKVEMGNGEVVYGHRVVFEVEIENKIKPIRAIAMNIPEKLVIGHDFMQDNDVIIDYVNEKIRFSKRIPNKNRRFKL